MTRTIVQIRHGTQFSLFDVPQEAYERAEFLWQEQLCMEERVRRQYPSFKFHREPKSYRLAGTLEDLTDRDFASNAFMMVGTGIAASSELRNSKMRERIRSMEVQPPYTPEQQVITQAQVAGMDRLAYEPMWRERYEQPGNLLLIDGLVSLLRASGKTLLGYFTPHDIPRVVGNGIMASNGVDLTPLVVRQHIFRQGVDPKNASYEIMPMARLKVMGKAFEGSSGLLNIFYIERLDEKQASDLLGPFHSAIDS